MMHSVFRILIKKSHERNFRLIFKLILNFSWTFHFTFNTNFFLIHRLLIHRER